MWGNIFAGAMSLAQGDSPEEILKKQAMATVTGGMTGGAPVGVDSVGAFAPHLAQTGMEQAVASGVGGGLGSAVGGELGSEMITQNPALTNGMGQSSNMFTQFGRDAGGYMSGMGDTMSEYGTAVNDFTGMENRDWTQLGLSEGLGAMEGNPNQPIMHSPVVSSQGIPTGLENQQNNSLLSSHTKPNSPQGIDPDILRQLQTRGLL